jgi:RNA polymerase sigma-70 factor (ECF subfamily)
MMQDDDFAPGEPDASDQASSSRQVDVFMRLLSENQRRLALYVLSMVPRWADAEEVIQETNLVLWREFGKFRPGSNFAAWACTVAFHQVRAWRKRQSRQRIQFSDAFLEVVAREVVSANDRLETRARFLSRCMEKLPADRRELVRQRYADECSIEELAERTGRTESAVYRALSRVRRVLYECVNRSMALEGQS